MCAEIMGKKVTAASYVYRSERNSASSGSGQNASLSLKKDEKASKNMDLPTKTPRFALELDGLNCFETIVRS
ncbi:unnamed protein product [Arabidopsis arenosa]|uniref:Uncharacterized protein n=1 Tax=Arabidopsis arenosa TaxID=38785 RepID=A0A8S1ZR86_ARAAE|nr:unnamed protein product [Arabidopsis arenosa]